MNSTVKCGEADLAVDVCQQLRQEGFQLERPVYHTVLEVYLKLGRWDDVLGVLADMQAQVCAQCTLDIHLCEVVYCGLLSLHLP